jgi:excisionase family DNA binding protein
LIKERLLDVREVSGLLYIHPETLYRWKKSGRIPHVMMNGRVRFERKAVDEFLEKRKSGALDLEAILPKFSLSLDAYDKLHLKRQQKGGTSAVGKGPRRRWNYSFGSVYLRGKHWYIDYRYLGKRIREAVKNAQTRGEAVIALQVKVTEIFNGRFNPKRTAPCLTFDEFADKYMNEYAKSEKKSWKTDEYRLRRIREFFGRFELSEITTAKIREYRDARCKEGISRLTTNRELSLFKKMFNWGLKEKCLSENPAKEITKFSEADTARDRVLSDEEEERLFAQLAPHMKPLILTALQTGLRYREILRLRWSNVDMKGRMLKVENTKSGRARFVPINSILFDEMLRLKDGSRDERVFPFTTVQTAFENARRRAGLLDLTFHDLRRTFGTRLLEKGVNIVTISKLYGHSSVLVTQGYLHPKDILAKEAVEALVDEHRQREKSEKVAQLGHKKKRESFQLPATSYFSVN